MAKRVKKPRIVKLPRSIRRMFPQVEFAVDAEKAVEVSVGKRDCDNAKRLDPTECALARAAKRELHADGVIIGLSASYIIKGKQAVRFATPESVQRELVSFDRHGDFDPGEYYLMPKAPSVRFGVKHDQRKHGKGGGNGKAKRKVHTVARVRILPKGQGD